ncbi:hypothetical protein NDU88_006195 [Pleurodeles waltl]|uniref:Uncharacterized protein n=1 Tax=Pleurodeles waltl TaxID=8319 RepID=A0AAV7MYI3_PLEWA|nr:hypothetical protein NDU88_006195 [Pleurodeles waltl]
MVTTAESQTDGLQTLTKRLEKQVQDLTKKQAEVATKLEDQEGRALRNNISISGVPEVLRGQAQALIGGKKKEKILQIEALEKEVRALEAKLPGNSSEGVRRQLAEDETRKNT